MICDTVSCLVVQNNVWCAVHVNNSPSISWLQLRGQTVESFVAEAQDKTRSALAKSLEAAYLAWEEQVRGDEIKFDAESLRSLPQSYCISIAGFHIVFSPSFHVGVSTY